MNKNTDQTNRPPLIRRNHYRNEPIFNIKTPSQIEQQQKHIDELDRIRTILIQCFALDDDEIDPIK